VATNEDWRAYAKGQERARASAEAETSNAILALNGLERQLEAEKSKVQSLDKQLNLERDTSRAEKDRLSRALTASQNLVTDLNVSVAALQKSLDTEVKVMRNQMKVELDRLHAQSIKDGDQIRGLQALLKDRDGTVENLTRSVRVLREQSAQAAAEVKDLRDRLKAVSPAEAAPTPPVATAGPKIEGSVTAVKVNIASLNVGLADGVKQDMEFIIYRGGDFVANLKVADVYPSTCAGIITRAQRDVRKGDKASTSVD
jgi:chromosome segregation ATPase